MNKSEKTNMAFALLGLTASVIAIFGFLTGIGSLPSLVKKPEPSASSKIEVHVHNPPVVVPPKKETSVGDVVVAPVKNGVDWAAKRLTPRKRTSTKAPTDDSAASSNVSDPSKP